MIREGVAHAALVFSEDEAVAWAEYGTPEELPSIHHRKQYDEGMVTRPTTESPASTSTNAIVALGLPRSPCAARSS
ncbi:MAG: hypothetical protein WKF83_06190 [Nocardioidaceae bacterium]